MTIRHVIRGAGCASLVLGAWAAILLVLPFSGSARELAVVGPRAAALSAIIGAGGRVVEVRRAAVIAIGTDADFAARLYRHGATLVVVGRIGAGCSGALLRKAGA